MSEKHDDAMDLDLDDLVDEILDDDLEQDDASKDDLDGLLDEILEEEILQENDESKVTNEKEILEETKESLQVNKEEPEKDPEKLDKKKSKKPLLVLFALILVALGGFFIWDRFLNLKTVDYFSNTKFILNGADGHGTISLDENLLEFEENENVEAILKEIKVEIEPQEGLKNGDVVKIEIVEAEEIVDKLKKEKYKLKSLKHELTVEGLGEGTELNYFDAITVTFANDDVPVTLDVDETKWDVTDEQKEVLKKIKFKEEKFEGLANGDTITVELELSKDLEKELLKEGIVLKETSQDYTVEGLTEAPKTKDELDILDELQANATAKIDSDYQKNKQSYKNFKVVSVCYTDKPTNKVNYKDYHKGHAYKNGSLMFIFEFDQITSSSTKKMYDAYGYTNILAKDGKVKKDEILDMSPFQDKASVNSIKNEMKQNNFTCD